MFLELDLMKNENGDKGSLLILTSNKVKKLWKVTEGERSKTEKQ